MLYITIPGNECYDELNNKFMKSGKTQTIALEHSLVSISKWESRWHKPFISKKNKTKEETIDYIKCMCINQVDDEVFSRLTMKNIKEINKYIENPMTATWFSEQKNNKKTGEMITSELIYYWMISLNIPFECQKWHLNRLLTLIQVCNIKNAPPKKMNKQKLMSKNTALNMQRRNALHSKG